MKKKIISMLVSEDEYKVIKDAAIQEAMKEDKNISLSAFTLNIVMKYINGSGKVPDTPNIEVSKKPHIDTSIETDIQEDKGGIEEAVGMFDGLNLDL